MNKRGFTILELLISIALVAVVLLLLLRVMLSLENINNDSSYASSDEIARTKIIKTIESDFLMYQLNGIEVTKNGDNVVITFLMSEEKELVITADKLTYENEAYYLNSSLASYSLDITYEYLELDANYYYVSITIPVLIDGVNTTAKDDIKLSFLGLKKEDTSYNF